MTGKKVEFGARPAAKPSADVWVGDRKEGEATKRLTLDIPASLHMKIKSACALRGVKMIDEIRVLLEDKYMGESK